MKLCSFVPLVAVPIIFFGISVQADTLYFQGSMNNILWSSVGNWYQMDGMGHLVGVNRLPNSTDNAIVTSNADGQAGVFQVNTLILQPSVEVDKGAFIVQTLQMNGFSFFSGSSVTVDSEMDVLGQGCGLSAATLIIHSGAFAFLSVSNQSRLNLNNGTLLYNEGGVILSDNTAVTGTIGVPSTNKFENLPGAVLSSSGNAFISVSSGAFVFDNSGTVRSDGGTLAFTGLTWTSTNGTGKFKAAVPNATIAFTSALNVDPSVTFLFTGPGSSQIGQSANIQGTLQIGAVDSGTGYDAGNLAVAPAVQIQGPGLIHVLASNGVPSTLTCSNAQFTSTAITIDAGAEYTIVDGGTMTSNAVNNAGTAILTGSINNITFSGGAMFNNLAGATFEIRDDSGLVGSVGSAFNNSGTFQKTSGSGITTLGSSSSMTFNNNGLLDIQTGSVSLFGGTSGGQFNTAGGTALMFGGGMHTMTSGATFTGSGLFQLNGPFHPTLFVNGNITMPNLQLGDLGGISATIDGPGQLTVTGPFTSENGTIQGSGTLNLPAGSTAAIFGSLTLDQRTINNSGIATCTGASATISAIDGAVVNNLGGALFDIQNDVNFGYGLAGAKGTFNNTGTFRRSAGDATAFVNLNFNNSGSVLVSTQTLDFQAAYQQTAGSTVVNSNATIQGSLLNVQGGILGGAGTINAAVNNSSGIVSPGVSPGLLTISGANTYAQAVAGTLSIELGGRTAGTQFDQLAVSGEATLGGSLNVSLINGFAPNPGDKFTILTCASRNGIFPVKNGTLLNNGLVLLPLYSNTNIVLLATNLTLLQPPLGFAQNGNNLQLAWPSVIGQPYQLEYSGDLLQWFVLSNLVAMAGNSSVIDPTPIPGIPKRFYRLR